MPFVQAANTSTTIWKDTDANNTVLDGNEALLRHIVTLMCDMSSLAFTSFTGTGTGKMAYQNGGVNAPTETWTITFSDATNFTVSGSVSGAQNAGTTGTAYISNGTNPIDALISFRIEVGGTAFVNTDAFVIAATENTYVNGDANTWILDQYKSNTEFGLYGTAAGNFLVMHGEGDGTEAIYIGLRFTRSAPTWNWEFRYLTGFAVNDDFGAQPGASPTTRVAWWDDDIPYWFISNARRFVVAGQVSNTYHAMYAGLFLAFGSPNEYPYPICVLGEKDDAEPWNSIDTQFNAFVKPGTDGAGYVRDVQGSNLVVGQGLGVTNVNLWPAAPMGSFDVLGAWENNENYGAAADHQLFPIVVIQPSSDPTDAPLGTNTFGVLDGVRRVTGTNQSVTTILTIDAVDHVVFNDIFRDLQESFWTLEMA